jgi:lysine-N-methylase
LRPDFAEIEANLLSGDFRTDNFFTLGSNRAGSPSKPYGEFQAVRAALVTMVRDRSRPLWLRLLRIGWLCRGMDAAGGAPVAALLNECRASEALRELETMPGDAKLRLEVVLALTDERMRDGSCGRRFQDTFWAFIEGIGSPVAAAPGSDLDRLLHAEEIYCRPFFERSPYVLENYLLNYIFQNLFPFGRQGSADFVERSMFDEYLLMTTQFAWIHTLLIGIAANYKDAFAEEHVVSTVQSFTRSVEHYPEVLSSIVALVRRRKLDNLQGMAILLKT